MPSEQAFASPPQLTALAAALRRAERVAVLTGAGVSAESGIPTFRDAQSGVWARFRPEEVASRAAFLRDPARVSAWYAYRRRAMRSAEPNAAHRALAELDRRVPAFVLLTQNIDGLHQRAGSRRVVELHGSIWRLRCFDDCMGDDSRYELDDGAAADLAPVVDGGTAVDDDPAVDEPFAAPPPRCPCCGGYLRPDVVWFGEMLPVRALAAAIEAARRCDLFLSVGTSGLVEPAASLAHAVLDRGAVVVEINLEATPLTPLATFVLHGPAGTVLPTLVREAWV